MPSTPTTKSQVQAYRFVLRRMQSALVRRDAVMLNDPMRTHTRATAVGIAIAVVAAAGFMVVGLLSPDPVPPKEGGILIGQQSGSVYVLTDNPRRLIPVFNLASAQLLWMAQQNKNSGGTAKSGSSAAQGPHATTVVDDKFLRDIPTTRRAGIPDGPELLPNADERLDTNTWAVCNEYELDPALPVPSSQNIVNTVAMAGVGDLGGELPNDQALYGRGPDNKTYLIYHTPTSANRPQSNVVRAEIDSSDSAIANAFGLGTLTPRKITAGLLDAIPAVGSLSVPAIDGEGQQDHYNLGHNVGQAFSVQEGTVQHDYMVLKDGIQQIPPAFASVLRFKNSGDSAVLPQVEPDRITNVPQKTSVDSHIDTSNYPNTPPQILDAVQHPVACLGWTPNLSNPSIPQAHTFLTVGNKLPLPLGADGKPIDPVDIQTDNPDGKKVDQFFMPPGRAAAVRGATGPDQFNNGPISLVSDRGVRYGIPDTTTATGLGLDPLVPAPESILSLLPAGPILDTQSVQRSFDTLPALNDVGDYPVPSAAPAAGGG